MNPHTLTRGTVSMMLVAIVSLFLVFLFVTLLHCYARWLLAQDGERRSSSVLVVPPVLGAHRLFILRPLLAMEMAHEGDVAPSTKGLEPRLISSIPQFVFRSDEEGGGDHGLECVVCLSLFGDGEKGKRLALCGHAFHVECIDMWLHSHTTCPICRAPAVKICVDRDKVVDSITENHASDGSEHGFGGLVETATSSGETRMSGDDHGRLEIVVEVPNFEDGSNDTCQCKVLPLSNSID